MTEEYKSEEELLPARRDTHTDILPIFSEPFLDATLQISVARRPLFEGALALAKGMTFRVRPEILERFRSGSTGVTPAQKIVSQESDSLVEQLELEQRTEALQKVKLPHYGDEGDYDPTLDLIVDDKSLGQLLVQSNKERHLEWVNCGVEEQQRRLALLSKEQVFAKTMRNLIDGKTSCEDIEATYAYLWEQYNTW
jgi:hypothetical protein